MMAHRRSVEKDEDAQVGIGTMIVFIATVLIAAIAAGILISSRGDLQEASDEGAEQASEGLRLESVVGKRDANTDAGLKDLEIFVVMAPGATDLDVRQLRVQIGDGNDVSMLAWDAAPGAHSFAAAAIRDADGSFRATDPVMTSGDLVRIDIDLGAAGLQMEFTPRSQVEIELIPASGGSVSIGFTTPSAYGTKTVLELR